MIGPSRITFVEEEEEEEEEEEQVEGGEPYETGVSNRDYFDLGIPVDGYATLKGHIKAVSCVAVDPKGHRMATGSLDYHVRLWDFHGMNSNLNSFRIIEPFSGNAIRNIEFNGTGSHLMILNGGKQITMLDRDGVRNMLTVKGYMYVKQLHLTKGHTNTIYDGHFHPINGNQFASASGDGSIRLWNLQQKLEGIEQQLAHKTLVKCKDARGVLTGVTGLGYTRDGKLVFGGCMDGSLQGFSVDRNHHRPEMVVRDAHQPWEEYTSIISSQDGAKIFTRNTDNTLKVWDLRMINKPIVHYSHFCNNFPGSKLCWSPDYRFLLVGTSVGHESDEKQSYLHFLDGTTFQKVKTMTVGDGSVTGVAWSKILNQIVLGTSSGQTRIYFDERISLRGALKAIDKQPRVDKDPKFDYSAPVYLPHSLPMYQQRPTNNIKKDKQAVRKDPILSAKPFLPQQGPHKNARDNSAPYTQIQHVVQALNANLEKVYDARKPLWEIQKYTKETMDYTRAYQNTQPVALFNPEPTEQKQFKFLETIEKICPHCGLKLCTCILMSLYESEEEEEDPKKY